jgi:hypothetical protein
MGGTGFPTLMFLNSDGKKIQKQGARSVKAFDETLDEVQEFLDLAKAAEAGDDKAATAVLIQQLELGWFDLEEAQMRRDALKSVSSKQKKLFTQLLIDTEIRSQIDALKKIEDDDASSAAHRALGKKFMAMWDEKRLPGADNQRYSFWWAIAAHAEEERDKKTLKKVVKEFDKLVDDNHRYRTSLKRLEDRVKNLPKK